MITLPEPGHAPKMPPVMPPRVESLAVVDKLLEDIEDSVYLGAALLVLTPTQRARLKQRWAKIIDGSYVDRDWANY